MASTLPSSLLCTSELTVATPEGGYSPAPIPTTTRPKRINKTEGLTATNSVAALTSSMAMKIVVRWPSQEAMNPEKIFIPI